MDSDIRPDDDTAGDVQDDKEGKDEEPVSGRDDEDTPSATDDEDTPPVDPAQDNDSLQDSVSRDSHDRHVTSRHTFAVSNASDHVDSTVTVATGQSTRQGRQHVQKADVAKEAAAIVKSSLAPSHDDAPTSAATRLTAATAASSVPTPSQPLERPTPVSVAADFVAAVLQPFLSPGEGSPIQIPMLSAALSLVRNEFERILFPRNAIAAPQQTSALVTDPRTEASVDPTEQHVLVIGVDGANLSRILADPENENFVELMETSTTAPASIVGHTTLSNPSWTAIMTGAWGERTGVINNVFTPWTYDTWPTVYNQLEALDPAIETMAIANWTGINAIAGAGSLPADQNVFVPQIEGDTNWSQTDDAVADRAVAAIQGENAPNFLFTYFAGVDENGHMFGGGSPEYAAALRNADDNLGEIMDAVAAREAATGEDWTIIVVTDHGHTSQLGFGHGFQSPDETETFVIADGPDFQDGHINLRYEIVDTTPTVVSLFGGTPRPDADGVPLMTLGGSDVDPVDLQQALNDAIAMHGYPDVVTNVALGLRTVFATVPYVVHSFGNDAIAGLPPILMLPASIVIDGLYVATNIPAQIVAQLTGVTGASIFPLLPPEVPVFPPTEEAILPDSTLLVSCGAPGSAAGAWCGEQSVA